MWQRGQQAGVLTSSHLYPSMSEMLKFRGSGTRLLHWSVCANESAQHLHRAHRVGEIFVASLCSPRAVREN